MAAVLTTVVLVGVPRPGPLDDPAQGEQRTGFLIDRDEARHVPVLALPGDPVGRVPVVVVFDRALPSRRQIARFLDGVPRGFAIVVVSADDRVSSNGPTFGVAQDPTGAIARAVGMPVPRDGGPPVGYALIDDRANVRYATLDPGYRAHGYELEIVAGALT